MKGHCVAIVDEDEAVRHSLQALLEAAGLSVDVFPNGEDFLAARIDCDCAILDLHLPGLDGIATMRRLRDGGAAIPVILISARLDPGSRARAAHAGIAAVLEKPLQEETLLQCIGRALGSGLVTHQAIA
jgi:FixJ family two-component response regulator